MTIRVLVYQNNAAIDGFREYRKQNNLSIFQFSVSIKWQACLLRLCYSFNGQRLWGSTHMMDVKFFNSSGLRFQNTEIPLLTVVQMSCPPMSYTLLNKVTSRTFCRPLGILACALKSEDEKWGGKSRKCFNSSLPHPPNKHSIIYYYTCFAMFSSPSEYLRSFFILEPLFWSRARKLTENLFRTKGTMVQMFKNEMYRENGASRWEFSKCTQPTQAEFFIWTRHI